MALLAAGAVLAGGVSVRAETAPPPEAPTGRTSKQPVYAQRHMVAAANPLAVQVGLAMLRAGGSAADAAIAVQLVLNLVEPQSSGVGGGAFALYWDAGARRLASYDGRETAPAAATGDLFRLPDGRLMPFRTAVRTGRAVGVPGTVALLWMLHRRHGRLPWARLFQPAVRLAEAGFPVSPRLHRLLARADFLKRRPAARAYFFTAGGKPLPVGYRRNNPAFAATLRRLAQRGPAAFYRGPVARDMVAAVRGDRPWPGGLSLADLAGYRAFRRPAVCGRYRGWRICGMGPPSSGGIAVLQILGHLERFDLSRLSPTSPRFAHLLIESGRLAFADRGRYVADPAFVRVPVRRMLDPAYLRRRGAAIDPSRSLGRARPGVFDRRKGALPARGRALEVPSTSHIAIVDGQGNALSMTTTIEAAFGSGIMVRGFLLNNELTDFSFRPPRASSSRAGRQAPDSRRPASRQLGPVANRVQGGKRPRSSMSPTLVFDRAGRFYLAIGSPGGSRIIGYVARALIAILDQGRTVQQAADLPHVLSRNGPAEIEKGAWPPSLAAALKALGHRVWAARMASGLHGIRRLPDGRLEGGADPRREGVSAGD